MGNRISGRRGHASDSNTNLIWAVDQLGRWEEKLSDTEEDRKLIVKELAERKAGQLEMEHFPSLSKKYLYAHQVLQKLVVAAEQNLKLNSMLKEKKAYKKRHPSKDLVNQRFDDLDKALTNSLSAWDDARSAAAWLQQDYELHYKLRKVLDLIYTEQRKTGVVQSEEQRLTENKVARMQEGDRMVTGGVAPPMHQPELNTLGRQGGGDDTSSSSSSSSDNEEKVAAKRAKRGAHGNVAKYTKRKLKLERQIYKHQLAALRIGFQFLDTNRNGFITRTEVPDLDPKIFSMADQGKDGKITLKDFERTLRTLHKDIIKLDAEVEAMEKLDGVQHGQHGSSALTGTGVGQPAYNQTSVGQPAYNQQGLGQTGYNQPLGQQTGYGQPAYNQPSVGQQGLMGQPGYNQQGLMGQPGYNQQGVMGQPGYNQQGLMGQPGYNQPTSGAVGGTQYGTSSMQSGIGGAGMGMPMGAPGSNIASTHAASGTQHSSQAPIGLGVGTGIVHPIAAGSAVGPTSDVLPASSAGHHAGTGHHVGSSHKADTGTAGHQGGLAGLLHHGSNANTNTSSTGTTTTDSTGSSHSGGLAGLLHHGSNTGAGHENRQGLLAQKRRERNEKRRMYDEICSVITESFTNSLLQHMQNVTPAQMTQQLAAITQEHAQLEHDAVRKRDNFSTVVPGAVGPSIMSAGSSAPTSSMPLGSQMQGSQMQGSQMQGSQMPTSYPAHRV